MKKILSSVGLAVLLIFAASVLSGSGCCGSIVKKSGPGIHQAEIRFQAPWSSLFKIKRIPGNWNGQPENTFNVSEGEKDYLVWPGEHAEYAFYPGNIPGRWMSQVDIYIDQNGPRRVYHDNPRWNYQWGYSLGRELGAGDHLIKVTATYTSPEGLEPIVQEKQFWLHICPDRACHWWRLNP